MAYTSSSYTPTYYTSLHDSIASLCKNILPFSFKKRRLPAILAAEQSLSKQQSDNLKWQQDSFHQIHKLMGLCKEGILPETEVSVFRSHLLHTLVAAPSDLEQPTILRDKLVFLQDLLHAKCISEGEYHSSKRPLLQRLADQGAVIEARDVIIAEPKKKSEEWSVIDLKDENCLPSKESSASNTKSKNGSAMKQIKGAASKFGFVPLPKTGKGKEDKGQNDPGPDHYGLIDRQTTASSASGKNELGLSRENPFWDGHLGEKKSENGSIFMSETLPVESMKVESQSEGEKGKKKMFRTLFQKDLRGGHESGDLEEEKASRSAKKQWGFDGFKKWKNGDSEDETAPLPLSERSDSEAFLGSSRNAVAGTVGEGADTKQIKRKIHSNGSSSEFFVDKVLGKKVKKELSRIQAELNATNPNLQFSNDHIEAISTRLPVDKADLKNFFPKAWCDQYGDIVVDVVKKEFKDHVGEMGSLRNTARVEKQNGTQKWATFDDEENCHPNLFAPKDNPFSMKQGKYAPLRDDRKHKCFKNNPFFPDYEETEFEGNKQKPESAIQGQNPFWTPRLGSSMLG